MPTVVVDRSIPGLVADLVRVDHEAGAELAVAHLLSLGHRAVACISGPSEFAVSRARVAGWRKAMARKRVRIDEGWLLEGEFSASAGHVLTRRLLARGDITALFASNDLQGIGALRAAAELGVRVPRDLSVIGFDGIELGSYVYPALTTSATRSGRSARPRRPCWSTASPAAPPTTATSSSAPGSCCANRPARAR